MKATNAAKKAVKAAKSNAKGETTKALALTLDVKQSHKMRQSAADALKVDLFALHAFKQTSRAYVQLCAESAAKVIDSAKGKSATHVLVCGGVANYVCVGAEGFYSRSHGSGALVGNVDALRKLYGTRIELFAVSDIETRFAAIKEQVTRRIGTSKNAVVRVGREFATYEDKFAMFSADLLNGKRVIYNGEHNRNAHNYAVRAQNVKTTVTTAATK